MVMQVVNAIFEPPPFQPSKLSVSFMPGTSSCGPAPPSPRCYTLTHNDLTGSLQLSIGPSHNQRQVHGFYTRWLRDEIIAEWRFASSAWSDSQPGSLSHVPAGLAHEEHNSTRSNFAFDANALHTSSSRSSLDDNQHVLLITCHVSGEEKWLATPQLRNYIFRREMTLVLETFMYGDRHLLQHHPSLQAAEVWVHFQSDLEVCQSGDYHQGRGVLLQAL
eukprot:jgi/Chrzof1/2003/Cz10g29110.t1_NYE1[v5.2]